MPYEYKRISGLTEKTQLGGDDAFAVDNADNVASQKVTWGTLRTQLKTYFNLGNLASGHYIQGNSFAGDLALLDTEAFDQHLLIDTVLADLAPVQVGITATRAYTEGSYLIYNNQFYMVIQNIAAGSTMLVGTNIMQLTVGSALITTALAIAAAYDASENYDVGDVVTHLGGLYVCITPTSGAWNSSRWTAVTVADLILSVVDDLTDDITDILSYLAPEYSSSSRYWVGNCCIHDGVLYKCTTPISSSGEEWNPEHWTTTDIASLIGPLGRLSTTAQSDLISAINEVDGHADLNAACIGTLAYLTTTAQSNLVAAINEVDAHADANAAAIENIGFHSLKVVTLAGITSLPKTFTAQGITADHKLIQEGSAYVSPRSSMADGWTLTTGNGTITVSGTFSGSTSTTIIATMGIPDSTVTGVAQ